jgi:hypothetical protein
MTDPGLLQAGYEFPPQVLRLDQPTIAAYVAAVGDGYPGYAGAGGVAPPLAVLALAMRGLADLIAQHPGSLHVTQQLAAARAVPIGSVVTARLQVKNRSERRGFAALTLTVSVDLGDDAALRGSMLLMVPLAAGGVAGA